MNQLHKQVNQWLLGQLGIEDQFRWNEPSGMFISTTKLNDIENLQDLNFDFRKERDLLHAVQHLSIHNIIIWRDICKSLANFDDNPSNLLRIFVYRCYYKYKPKS